MKKIPDLKFLFTAMALLEFGYFVAAMRHTVIRRCTFQALARRSF